jgi:adenylate kinase
MIILLMGPQGSGKTTQAQLLAQKLDLPFLSMGRILRYLYDDNEPLAVQAKVFWEKGELVPDQLVQDILRVFFLSRPHPNGFIMEGFPRDLAQYSWMQKVFPEKLTVIIEIKVEPEHIATRIDKRREKENRLDESPAVLAKRLKIYYKETASLFKQFHQDRIPVIEVDGHGSIDNIHQTILNNLKKIIKV